MIVTENLVNHKNTPNTRRKYCRSTGLGDMKTGGCGRVCGRTTGGGDEGMVEMMRWVIAVVLAGIGSGVARGDGLLCIAGHYLGALATSEDGVREIVVEGDYAYLADRGGGLVIADVSDPDAPFVVGTLPAVGFALDMAVDGDLVFVGTAGEGMAVVDGSDRSAPSIVGRYGDGLDVLDLFIEDGVAYLACSEDGVRVVDVSSPASPAERSRISTDGALYSLGVYGDRLYAPYFGGGLRVYDISDPAEPIEVGAIDNDKAYFGISIDGGLACVLNRGGTVETYDLTGGGTPVLLSTASFNGGLGYDVLLSGQRMLVSERMDGVREFDMSDPTQPRLVFVYPIDGFAYGFDLRGDTLFVGNDAPGMQIIGRVSEGPTIGTPRPYPFTPVMAGDEGYLYVHTAGILQALRIEGPGVVNEVGAAASGMATSSRSEMCISGDRLYTGNANTRDVSVHDLSDPASPVLLGVSRGQEATSGVLASDGGIVYQAGASLEIRDLTEPALGVTLSVTALSSYATGAWLDGQRLYLLVHGEGLVVFDVSDPASPSALGSYTDDDAQYSDLIVREGYAYCIGLSGAVHVIDISDPASPFFVGGVEGFGQLHEMALYGDTLFVSGNGAGQTLIDVSDPAQPTVVIAANEYGTVGSIVVDHEVAYFTMPDSLVSYDLSGCVLCRADLTGDGVVNFFDVSAFLVAYTGGEPGGDWNGDGVINFFDVSGFLVDFNAGCP